MTFIEFLYVKIREGTKISAEEKIYIYITSTLKNILY